MAQPISPLKTLIHAAEDECKKHGCERYAYHQGGKHIHFWVRNLTAKRLVTISKSPSCPFVEKKVRRDVRHALKELGYGPL